jgi:calcineurin-like phosphoesterase family protein
MMTFSRDPVAAEREMHALIYYLTAFGYIDGHFDPEEKGFIRTLVGRLVEQRARGALRPDDPTFADVVARWTRHFHQVLDDIDGEILSYFTESVGEGESTEQFVIARLKLRCFELHHGFSDENHRRLLATVDELMHADGVVHPNERAFRDELERLVHARVALADLPEKEPPGGAADVIVEPARRIVPRVEDHEFFKAAEWDWAPDPATFAEQARPDMNLLRKTIEKLDELRDRGAGRLRGAGDVGAFAGKEPFLDGHVWVFAPRPDKDYELVVIGDLHGCYSCLKAALMQSDFFAKVEAHHRQPDKHPETKLVLLGDYIDRGRYSYNGILRTAMQLFLTVPEHVYLLRGNHEYYVEYGGKVLAPVRPAEAMNALVGIAPNEVFAEYMRLFEALPNCLLFDRTLFVHAGIPRDGTVNAKWRDLSSLNDPEIRFEMLWSDPSEADAIPEELQNENARFPFGRLQFARFMARLGCTTLVRGHERITEGFRQIYDLPEGRLFSLFSAGGKVNRDLPEESNYREVTPMALTIRHKNGSSQIAPFILDYERYNDPRNNAFVGDGS